MRGSRAAAALDHPNILPVYDAGEADGVLYLSTRFVDGTDLGRLLESEGPLAPEAASTIVTRCAAALDAAHAHGLVHGGLVPAAILLERGWEDGGRIFISDFGITRHVASSTRLTRTGSFAGSVDYVAPEEIRGESDVDGRADVYSLGCILYHCLTGEVPFPRESELVTIFAHLEDPPPQASHVRPDLPSAIDPVIERALAKPPRERFSSCLELAEAASLALGSTPATDESDGGGWAPPPAADRTIDRGTGRSRSLRYVGIVVAALLLVVTGVLIGRWSQSSSGGPSPRTGPRAVVAAARGGRAQGHRRRRRDRVRLFTACGGSRPLSVRRHRRLARRRRRWPRSCRSGTTSTNRAASRTTSSTTTRGGGRPVRSRNRFPETASTHRTLRRIPPGTSSTSVNM